MEPWKGETQGADSDFGTTRGAGGALGPFTRALGLVLSWAFWATLLLVGSWAVKTR